MTASLLSPLLTLLFFGAPPPQPELPAQLTRGLLLTYQGTLVADQGAVADTQKEFQLSVLISKVTAESVTCCWTLNERGRGAWSWLDQFGKVHAAAGEAPLERPSLWYQRDEGSSVVELPLPFFFPPAAVSPGSRWTQQQLDYVATQADQLLRIDSQNAYGRQRSLWMRHDLPLIAMLEQPVVLGQGERYHLQYRLAGQRRLIEPETVETETAVDRLLALRDELGFAAQTPEPQWTVDRLQRLRSTLPGLAASLPAGPLADVLEVALRDAARQEQVTDALSALQRQLLGQPAPQPALYQLDGQRFPWSETRGRVTVLHFWTYQDAPLEQPYGQTAYLDYLYRRLPAETTRVYGVAVGEGLRDPSTRRSAIQSSKKFTEFMHLSYPVLLDYGQALAAFGNPQRSGARLPLYLVLDRQGKIAHYQLGLYAVDPQKGLTELERAVQAAEGNRE